jgi:hypothetical protein
MNTGLSWVRKIRNRTSERLPVQGGSFNAPIKAATALMSWAKTAKSVASFEIFTVAP